MTGQPNTVNYQIPHPPRESETDFDPNLVCWNTEGKDGTVKLSLRSDCEYFKLEILWRNHWLDPG